jgi:undecaprenyl-diphosphatase
MHDIVRAALALALFVFAAPAPAAGGPLGIDHRLNRDERGIWSRSNQLGLRNALVAGELALALWEGGETRLGRTSWQAIDSSLVAAVATEAGKRAFGRERPYQTDDPNRFFHGGQSFPSGEVALASSVVTPFVLEYGHDAPAVYLLELLPAYDAVARMKSQAHWQTDVLAAFALGTATGWYAHSRAQPLTLTALPHGFMVGIRRQF